MTRVPPQRLADGLVERPAREGDGQLALEVLLAQRCSRWNAGTSLEPGLPFDPFGPLLSPFSQGFRNSYILRCLSRWIESESAGCAWK